MDAAALKRKLTHVASGVLLESGGGDRRAIRQSKRSLF